MYIFHRPLPTISPHHLPFLSPFLPQLVLLISSSFPGHPLRHPLPWNITRILYSNDGEVSQHPLSYSVCPLNRTVRRVEQCCCHSFPLLFLFSSIYSTSTRRLNLEEAFRSMLTTLWKLEAQEQPWAQGSGTPTFPECYPVAKLFVVT